MSSQLLIFGLALLVVAGFNWWQASHLINQVLRSSASRFPPPTIDPSSQKTARFILWLSAFCTAIAFLTLLSWLKADGVLPNFGALLLKSLLFSFPLWCLYRFLLYRQLTQKLGYSPVLPSRPQRRRRRKSQGGTAYGATSFTDSSDRDDSEGDGFFGLFGGEGGGGDSDGGGFWESFGGGGESGGSDFGGGEGGGGECGGGDF